MADFGKIRCFMQRPLWCITRGVCFGLYDNFRSGFCSGPFVQHAQDFRGEHKWQCASGAESAVNHHKNVVHFSEFNSKRNENCSDDYEK